MEEIGVGGYRDEFLLVNGALVALLQRARTALEAEFVAILLFSSVKGDTKDLFFPRDYRELREEIRGLVPWPQRFRRKPPPKEVELPRSRFGVSRAMFFPLHHYGCGLLGVLVIGGLAGTGVSGERKGLAQALADQAALLFVEGRYRARLKAIYALSEGSTSLKDEQGLIGAAVRIIQEAFHYGHVGLYLREGDILVNCGGAYSDALARDEEMFRSFKRIPVDRGICGRVIRTGRSVLVPDVKKDPDYIPAHPAIRSELTVPITAGGEVLGLINIESPQMGAFNREDKELLESLGRQLGVALSELRYRRTLEVREAFLRALNETASLDELLRYILGRAMELLAPKADAGSVVFYDEARGTYRFRVTLNRPMGTGECAEAEVLAVLRPDGPTLLTRSLQLASPLAKGWWGGGDVPVPGSTVAIPVRDPESGKVIAFLNVSCMEEEGAFTAADAEKLWSFREEIAAAVLRARNLERIRELAFHDPLTGVYNRHFLSTFIEESGTHPPGGALPLVLLDLDSFSEVNDRFGHLEGDRVLKEVGDLLRRRTRPEDIVVRYGGDEFLLLLPGRGVSEAEEVARALRDDVRRWDPGLGGMRVSFTFGIAVWDPTKEDFDRAVQRADASLYRERRRGLDSPRGER